MALCWQRNLEQLKENFKAAESRSERVQMLIILPRNSGRVWCFLLYMIQKSNTLVQEKGILSLPFPKSGRVISQAVRNIVSEFYLSKYVSKQNAWGWGGWGWMGETTCRSLYGNKQYMQKHLVLCNLKNHISSSKYIQYPDKRIGFSKFTKLCT